MGARLCKLLDSLDENPKSVLRQLLTMKMTHQHSELQGYMTNEQIKVRGTTLFLAELYMQLRKLNVSTNSALSIILTELISTNFFRPTMPGFTTERRNRYAYHRRCQSSSE